MKTKVCSCCNEIKSLDHFYNNSTKNDGKHTYCKKCSAKYRDKQRKTKSGVICVMYTNQRQRSKRCNQPYPSYSLDESREWLFGQDLFHELYNNWVESGYDKWLKPSVDRIDDYRWYDMDNIQLMTWEGNSLKHHSDVRDGINNKRNKTVLQYDLDGNFIKEYHSVRHAARKNKFTFGNIATACRDDGVYNGYLWKYKNEL